MGKYNRIPRWATLAVAPMVAVLILWIVLALVAGNPTRAAPLREGSGSDPHIAAITITANLPISDTRPGDGVDKMVYFSNSVPGVLTLTFEISGTPTLSLTAGAAFDAPTRVYTSDDLPWIQAVTYSLAATHTHQPNVAYTAVNTDAQATTVAITYVQDITAPMTTFINPPPGYFTGTQLVVTGTASDHAGGSGVRRVYVMTATTWVTATGTTGWTYTATFPITDGVAYTLSARAIDFLGTASAIATRAITVDNVPPGAAAPVPHRSPWVTGTVVYTWPALSDGSGILGYRVNVTSTGGYTAVFWADTLALTVTDLAEGVGYYARVQAVDGAGNAGDWSGLSTVITPDQTAPTVVVTAPAQIATGTFTVSWSAQDNLSGPSGTYSVYYREDNGSWQLWLSGTSLTQATFVSGTLDHTYTFRVTTTDRAGNPGEGTTTTKVAKWQVYIPLAMRNWVWWYQYDIYEPNDTPAQAYGPLTSGQTYQAYIWDETDQDDYYHFTPSTGAGVSISLTNIPSGCDYDLYVYYYDGQYRQVAYSNRGGNADEGVTFAPVAGRKYYVRVYRCSGFSSQQPYRLRVSYQ